MYKNLYITLGKHNAITETLKILDYDNKLLNNKTFQKTQCPNLGFEWWALFDYIKIIMYKNLNIPLGKHTANTVVVKKQLCCHFEIIVLY